jgi:hypothetical protein
MASCPTRACCLCTASAVQETSRTGSNVHCTTNWVCVCVRARVCVYMHVYVRVCSYVCVCVWICVLWHASHCSQTSIPADIYPCSPATHTHYPHTSLTHITTHTDGQKHVFRMLATYRDRAALKCFTLLRLAFMVDDSMLNAYKPDQPSWGQVCV